MLSNRHVAAALIVLPLLSLLGWWAAGALVGARPQPAKQGESYPLSERSGCRYAGGICELENVDVRLVLVHQQHASGHFLEVRASLPLDGVVIAVAPEGEESPPQAMGARDDRGRHWRLALPGPPGPSDRVRLVASARGVTWFGEAGTAFVQTPSDRPLPR